MKKIIFILTLVIIASCVQRNKNMAIDQTSGMTRDTLIADNYVLSFYNSDSFPAIDIYGDLSYRINLTDTIGNWHNRAQKIQSYLSNKFGEYFYTTDSTLVLKLANGKTLSFLKWDEKNDEGYNFEHYFNKVDYILLRVQWGEGNCWMLVNRKNGLKKYISGLPYISLDNKHILAINTDLEAGYSFNGLELYSILDDSLKIEFSKETTFGPTNVKWIGNNELLIRREHFQVDKKTGILSNYIDYKRMTIE